MLPTLVEPGSKPQNDAEVIVVRFCMAMKSSAASISIRLPDGILSAAAIRPSGSPVMKLKGADQAGTASTAITTVENVKRHSFISILRNLIRNDNVSNSSTDQWDCYRGISAKYENILYTACARWLAR